MLAIRLFYSLKHLWLNRKYLRQYLNDPSIQLTTISNLNITQLARWSIQAVILDYDGVLAPHGESRLPLPIASWLKDFLQHYPGQVFVLSNNLFRARLDYLAHNWPKLQIVKGLKKKPYPDGILQIMHNAGFTAKQVLIIDDRIATGLLAAKLAGIKGILIKPALVNYKYHPIKETFFAVLRQLEIFICRL